jgi:hypothetical protein
MGRLPPFSVIALIAFELAGKKLTSFPPNTRAWPVPKNIRFKLDENSRNEFAYAKRYVGFTGVCNMDTGRIHLNSVAPRDKEGQFYTDPIDRLSEKELKAMIYFGLDELEPIHHEFNTVTRDNFGTSHEQLAKEASGVNRDLGKGEQIPQNYVGFTVFKHEGTSDRPHVISFRSGTLNHKFTPPEIERIYKRAGKPTAKGLSAPKNWVDAITKALREALPRARPGQYKMVDREENRNFVYPVRY